MREIEFRGYDESSGLWRYGFLLFDGRLTYIAQIIQGKIVRWHVNPNTVGQFTGLLDKNGKKIFEGDILRVREYENLLMNEFSDDADRFDLFTLEEIRGKLKVEYASPVVFLDGGFQISTRKNDFDMFLACLFGDMKRSSPSFEFEVIGNILDTPELLENK